MKQENKRCGSCNSFRAYYTKGYCCLMKESNGYCIRHDKVMEKGDICEEWHCRHLSRKKRIRIVVNSIPEIYGKIAIIEQILKEDDELQKIIDETDDIG